jgi:pimeloyl-ACP methyl ester carboxylesterase
VVCRHCGAEIYPDDLKVRVPTPGWTRHGPLAAPAGDGLSLREKTCIICYPVISFVRVNSYEGVNQMPTYTVHAGRLGPVQVEVTEYGTGRAFLLLHGGAGPQSVARFGEMLAATGSRVIVPVHPGFGGTTRPESVDNMRGLALTYTHLLDELDLSGVTVIGNSIGGWIAAEMAVHASPRISGVVLADAGGLEVEGHPGADFFSLTPDQVTEMAYYQPEKFRIDVSALPEQAKAAMAGNQAALQAYTAQGMTDPSLLGRLSSVHVPVLVVWGAADRIYPPEHGEAFAKAIPDARLVILDEAGHLPQLEAPSALLAAVVDFTR